MNLGYLEIACHPLLELPLVILDAHLNLVSFLFCFVLFQEGGWREEAGA